MEINKKSWHYQLLVWTDSLPYEKDFCSYWRALIGVSAIAFIMLAAALCAAVFCLIIPIKVFGWFYGLIVGVSMIAICVLIVWIATRESSPEPKGLIATRYDTWKKKYCPTITYKD
jgi:hypothetical protein